MLFIFLSIAFKGRKRIKAIGSFAAFIVLYLSLAFLFLNEKNRSEFQSINNTEKYIHNILNGFNGEKADSYKSPQDSIKQAVLYDWYFADIDTVLNQDFLEELGSYSPFKLSVLKNWKKNLQAEIYKANAYYNDDYMPDMNWLLKTYAFMFIISILPFLFAYYLSIDGVYLFKTLGFGFAVAVFIFLVTVFFKMEDRALTPFLIFVFLAIWTLASESKTSLNKEAVKILIVLFIIVATHRVQGYRNISAQRQTDLLAKVVSRSNLAKLFPDRTVFFDLYSLTILETHPFYDVNYPNNWISSIEMFNLHSKEHHQQIIDRVGCMDWPCFYQEIKKKPDEFAFFYTHSRVDLTTKYNKLIYNEDLKFKKESYTLPIEKLSYSFLWYPMWFGYFTIDTTTETSENPIIEIDSSSISTD